MPLIPKEREEYYITQIRRLLVRDPDASIVGVQEYLKVNGIDLDRMYVSRLVKRIDERRTAESDKFLLRMMLVQFMERVKETDRYLWNILSDDKADRNEKINAVRELRRNFKEMFEVMFDSGVFDRKLGEMSFDMRDVLSAVRQIEKNEKLQRHDSEDQTRKS